MEYEVTIGIPVYNVEKYIRSTLESALAQTFSSIEILICDDCATDGSVDIIRSYQQTHPRGRDIRILHHSRNMGVGPSRNRLIQEARGHYLFFMDADDLIETDTIETLMTAMEEQQADVVYGSYDKIDRVHYTPTQPFLYDSQTFVGHDAFAMYMFSQHGKFQVSVCNCLLNLDFLRRNQLHFIDALFWEDMAFTYDMAVHVERAVLLSDVTYHYLCRPNSLSNYQDREVLQRDEILNNVSTIDYLKGRCYSLREKPYISSLCYVLQVNSFYIVCFVLKFWHQIEPRMSYRKLRQIMHHPMSLWCILHFRYQRASNLLLWLIGNLPTPLLILMVSMIRMIKKK